MARVNSDFLIGNVIPLLRRGGIVNWTVSKSLGSNHAIVFALILDKMDQHGKAEIFNLLDYFLLRMNISKRTLQTVIKELKDNGLINVKRGDGQKNYYSLDAQGCLSFLKTNEKVTRNICTTPSEDYMQNLRQNTNQRVKTKSKQTLSSTNVSSRNGSASLFGHNVEAILEYWEELGLTKPSRSDTRQKALNAIHAAMQHHTVPKIKKAMKVYADTLNGPYNKLNARLSVNNFLNPTGFSKKDMHKRYPQIKAHATLFDICLKGQKYTDGQFANIKVAKNEGMARLVQKYTKDKTGRSNFNGSNISIMNGLANNLEDFWNENKARFIGHTMRNASSRPGAIVQIYFKYLEEYGVFNADGFKLHYINSRQNIDNFYEWLIYNDMVKTKSRRARPHAEVAHTPDRQHHREGHSDRVNNQQRSDAQVVKLHRRRHLQN